LRYARQGWLVFPLTPGEKTPAGRLVPHGFKDASCELDVVATWWTVEPRANIGVATGNKFDVLDVDGDEGWCTLAYTVAEFGCLASAPASSTPSGGMHFFYLPTGLGNRASFLPSLDWRGAGGYVVVPPSVRSDGRRYEWALTPKEVELAEVPQWLHAVLVERKVPAPSMQSGVGAVNRYAQRALEGEVGRLAVAAVGTRNHALNVAAFNLGQLVAGGALDLDEVINTLVLVAQRAGLDDAEIEPTIASGLRKGMTQPRGVPA